MRLTVHELATDSGNPAGPPTVEITLEGRLDAQGVPELLRHARSPERRRSVVIDLSGLSSVDQAGRRALIQLRREGCGFRGGSLYINALLEEASQ